MSPGSHPIRASPLSSALATHSLPLKEWPVIQPASCFLNSGHAAFPVYPSPTNKQHGQHSSLLNHCKRGYDLNVDTTYISGIFEALLKPATPLLHASFCAGASEEALDAGVDRIEVPEKLLQIEVQMLQQIHFIDQHQIRGPEHKRVLQRLLLPFGNGVDHDPDVLTHPELRRTYQVPHVLDDKYVYVIEREFAEAGADHIRVQMALAAESWVGIHLHQGDVEAGQPVGVQGSLYVALEDAQTWLTTQPFERALEQRCLSRPRRAHHVDRVRSGPVEHVPICPGERVVGVQDVLEDHFLDRRAVHS